MKKERYRVQDAKTGEILVEGYVEDCVRKLGCSRNTIQTRKFRDPDHVGPRQRFLVTVLEEQVIRDQDLDGGQWAAARQWDEFCGPLRKKYGIEVKRWP